MGLKWQAEFTSNDGLACTLLISAKGYSGSIIDITLTENPVIHTWQTDEAKPAIKGSELEINILNRGVLPITDFVSSEDDFFFVEFKVGADTKFKGYLLQDDYSEVLVDYPHEINLKATDNIGLLKDVSLLDAAIANGLKATYTYSIQQTATDKIKLIGVNVSFINTYQYITIDSATAIDGQYQIETWQFVGADTIITVKPNLNGTITGTHTADITYTTPIELRQYMYLSELLNICIKSININLPIRVYGTIYATGTPNHRLFDQVKVRADSFSDGNNYDSCYTVIEKILSRFKFTFMQAEGYYNIIRWDELFVSASAIPGYSYDSNFVYTGTISLDTLFTFGYGESNFAEAGISYSIKRPVISAKETFNYKNPAEIIYNINLQNVGRLLSVTTVGSNTEYDYEAVDWLQGQWWTSGGTGIISGDATRIIRVILDADENEIDRFLVMKGGPNALLQIESNRVEVRKGDRVNFSYDVRVSSSGEKYGWRYFYLLLLTHDTFAPHVANDSVVNNDGEWGPSLVNSQVIGFIHPSSAGGEGWRDWTNISSESKDIPFDGVLILKLPHCYFYPGTTGETHYKNFKFEVIRNLAGQKKVKGHEHTDKQLLNIKNKDEKDIFVDNTLSNAIGGTLFLASRTGPLQDLVSEWVWNGNNYTQLGQITTTNELFWRRVSRIIVEGSIYNLTYSSKVLSALSVMRFTQYPGHHFVWGKLSINYKNDKASGTLIEMYNSADNANFSNIYGFRYLFD